MAIATTTKLGRAAAWTGSELMQDQARRGAKARSAHTFHA
jgi:hypothetical protein